MYVPNPASMMILPTSRVVLISIVLISKNSLLLGPLFLAAITPVDSSRYTHLT
jgi:hypothetical protein